MLQRSLKPLLALLALMLLPITALALEYKSVAVPKAVLYDGPSSFAKKTFLLSQDYPVEIIVNLGDWLKVRDAQGGLNWVEAKQLADKRTVIVKIEQAELKTDADDSANLIATLEKDVVLDLLDTNATNDWLKVKHRDGITGFVPAASVWGGN